MTLLPPRSTRTDTRFPYTTLCRSYEFPQFSSHRGNRQAVLYEAVIERIGGDKVHTGHHLAGFEDDGAGVTARFERRGAVDVVTVRGDLLIGADGIHSTVRETFYPNQGLPCWNGLMLWRGAVEGAPFLTGRSMVVAGGLNTKFVCSPIFRPDD